MECPILFGDFFTKDHNLSAAVNFGIFGQTAAADIDCASGTDEGAADPSAGRDMHGIIFGSLDLHPGKTLPGSDQGSVRVDPDRTGFIRSMTGIRSKEGQMLQTAVGSGIIRINEVGSERGIIGNGNDLQCVRS